MSKILEIFVALTSSVWCVFNACSMFGTGGPSNYETSRFMN